MSAWEEFLNERPIAVISTVGDDGVPHAVPVEVIVDGGRAYTWGKHASARHRNIEHSGAAALVAYKGHSYVMLQGPARLLDKTFGEYERITAMFLKKYDREETYGNDTLAEITPERVIQR